MKKTYKIFILLALLLISIPAFSQWGFGINVAYDNTGASWKYDGKAQKVNNISGFSITPTVTYEAVEEYLDIQSGLGFAMSGFSVQDNSIYGQNHNYSIKQDIILYYMQVPVYAVGKLPIKEATLLFEVGPILSAGVGSKSTISYKLEGFEYIDQDNENLFKETLHPFNCLIHFGIGAEYMGARITAGYNLGVFDIMRVDSDRSDLMTDGFFVSVGYVFDFD